MSWLSSAIEVLPKRLYFGSFRFLPPESSSVHLFCIDDSLVYEPFYADFGPLNLGCLYRYCQLLKDKLASDQHKDKKIIHYCNSDGQHRTNSIFLLAGFLVMEMAFSPEDSMKPFRTASPAPLPYRDASYGVCTYALTLADCMAGLKRAKDLNLINFATFDIQLYQYHERVENGDLNIVVPGKFVAFSGPAATRQEIDHGIYTWAPENYTNIFKQLNVTTVVRLNKKSYDRRQFTDNGFKHVEMYFIDGGVPSEQIIRQFLELSESDPGLIAVHCKAGLGRTGTLIAMYLMKHYGFTSAEVIGYLRIMRPGSVLGPQQFFLKQWERPMWAQGEAYRRGAPIQPYSGDSGYGKSSSASPKAAGGASEFSDSPLSKPGGTSSPVQQPQKKSPGLTSVLGSASPVAAASPASVGANGSALPRQLLPGISASSKTTSALTSSLGSMMLSTANGSPTSYSPSGVRPSASPPSPLMRSASFQSGSSSKFDASETSGLTGKNKATGLALQNRTAAAAAASGLSPTRGSPIGLSGSRFATGYAPQPQNFSSASRQPGSSPPRS